MFFIFFSFRCIFIFLGYFLLISFALSCILSLFLNFQFYFTKTWKICLISVPPPHSLFHIQNLYFSDFFSIFSSILLIHLQKNRNSRECFEKVKRKSSSNICYPYYTPNCNIERDVTIIRNVIFTPQGDTISKINCFNVGSSFLQRDNFFI